MSNDPVQEAGGHARWQLLTAGALAGISAGGFLVSLITHLHQREIIYIGTYEPAAALLGALGVWLFGSRRGAREGLIGIGAALLAMLVGDVFRTMSLTWMDDWGRVPGLLIRRFHWRYWPRLLRYAFGMYIGWYLCSAGRARESEADMAAGSPTHTGAGEEPEGDAEWEE